MGPLRFELRSEDPQSPRMARLPYGPALLLLAHFVYLSCYENAIIQIGEFYGLAGTTRHNPAFRRIFLISGFFPFSRNTFYRRKKKICIYVSIRYYELQRVVQQVPDYG
jgi:hypothetical protein